MFKVLLTWKIINAVLGVVAALQKVEGVIKADAVLKRSLQECKVPINLLDLLDHGNGLNPDCFSRGLLKEALGQLAGLRRRKLALEMLGTAIQTGLNQRDVINNNENNNNNNDKGENVRSQKRKLDTDDENCGSSREQQQKQQQQRPQNDETEPTAKKART